MNTDNQPTVKFSKEFITPSGLKEWVGIEWPVAADSDMEGVYKAFNEAKDFVCGWYIGRSDRSEPQTISASAMPPKVINREVERLMILLENATTKAELEDYKADVTRLSVDDPHIDIAYYRKLKELING